MRYRLQRSLFRFRRLGLSRGSGDEESKHPRIEVARGSDVSDVELRFGANERGHGWGIGVSHEMTSPTERLPTLEATVRATSSCASDSRKGCLRTSRSIRRL